MQAFRSSLALAAWVGFAAVAPAHFTMLFVQPSAAKKGQAVTVIYQWGHPFEHQLFNASTAQSLTVFSPDGKPSDSTKLLEKFSTEGTDGRKVAAYRARFTPAERGDYVFVLHTPPIWMEEEKEFYQDTAKVVLHVQAQKGWDASAGKGFELTPLTRPYGLLPGAVFQAQALWDGKPLSARWSKSRRYNSTPPKALELLPDEQITRAAKTDPNGVVTTTLPEPGWWCLAAQRDGGKKMHNGQMYPVRQRAIFWVHVEAQGKSKK